MKKKVLWITVVMSVVLVVVAVLLMKASFAQNVENVLFGEEIVIEDGYAIPDVTEIEFEIHKAGGYRLVAEWNTEEYGPLTGCVITDKDNKPLYQFTASTITVLSSVLELDEGEYKIKLHHIGGYEQYKSFCELVGWEYNEQDWEEWHSDMENTGSFEIVYRLKIQGEAYEDLFSLAMILLSIAIVAICIVLESRRVAKGDIVYDERQILVRGKGFEYAFFTMLIVNLTCGFLGMKGIDLKIDANVLLSLSALVGTEVYAIYCIWNDGYFALNKSIERTIGIMMFVGVVNLLIAIRGFIREDEFGQSILNLFVGIMTLVLGVVLLLKKYCKDRGED